MPGARPVLKTRKSGGVRVAAGVHRLIGQGDAARDEARWDEAAAAYRAALALAPALPHILLQLGHALKQAGRPDEADAIYAEAARQRPDDSEATLHRAHLAKQQHQPRRAAGHFAAILRGHPRHGEAADELLRLIEPVARIPLDRLRPLLDEIEAYARAASDTPPAPADPEAADGAEAALATDRPLVFDVTDLIGHFRHQRLPTGIQRVQIEVLATALATHGADRIAICCFISGRDDWIGVPLPLFRDLVHLAGRGGDVADDDWQAARARVFVHLALADHYVMPLRAVLVNLGTSLWVFDYFRFIRNAKEQRGISYIPLVYDLIPILMPEFCVRGLREEYAGWIAGVFQHADAFLAISQSTKRDLLAVAATLGHAVDEARIEVVPLDADLRQTSDPLPAAALARWNLAGVPFALLVSTIEPRKNHALAFAAWAELLRRHGAEAVPRLVCVGRDGWLNDDIYDRLDADPALSAHIAILHDVSDVELALLYRASRFTVYPSLYEGWGLPVTESLGHGRVPVVADNSSLPEAGGDLALMFESGSLPALVEALERVAFDDAWRQAREARIAAEFVPRGWAEVAAQIQLAVARRAGSACPAPVPRAVQRDLYYPVGRHIEPRIWHGLGSGEIFRAGDGWHWPEADGCRTKPAGGELRMRVAGPARGALRLYLRLRGLAAIACPVSILVGGRGVATATLRAEKLRWISCDLPDGAGPDLSVTIRGALAETVRLSAGGVDRMRAASVAVVGFLLCDRDDDAAEAAFQQARHGDLDAISAYREGGGDASGGLLARRRNSR